ncbi:hypothetical protein JCM6882_003308 [Rhodosporidiobolus microsporus]
MFLKFNVDWEELNTTPDHARVLELEMPPNAPPPFNSGTWWVGWKDVHEVDGQYKDDRLTFFWRDVREKGAFSRLAIEVRDEFGKVWMKHEAKDGEFPSALGHGSRTNDPEDTPAHLVLRLRFEPKVERVATSEQTQRFAAFSSTPTPHDVVLVFPRSKRMIWTTETLLHQSPYFATLFSSDFLEATNSNPQLPAPAHLVEPLAYDDSDDEGKTDFPPPNADLPAVLPSHKTITITSTSYFTYFAVLSWMQSKQIVFSALTSSFRSSEVTSQQEAAAHRWNRIAPSPPSSSTILPVSPKSVYRLADLLELPDLAALALDDFVSQLNLDNVAYELFSETAGCYEEVGNAVFDFAVDDIKEVFETRGVKEMKRRAESGELQEWEGRMWARLTFKLGEMM